MCQFQPPLSLNWMGAVVGKTDVGAQTVGPLPPAVSGPVPPAAELLSLPVEPPLAEYPPASLVPPEADVPSDPPLEDDAGLGPT